MSLKSDRFGMEMKKYDMFKESYLGEIVKIRPFRYGNVLQQHTYFPVKLVKIRPFRYGNNINAFFVAILSIKLKSDRFGMEIYYF